MESMQGWGGIQKAGDIPRPARRKTGSERATIEHFLASGDVDADVIDVVPMAGYAPKIEITGDRIRISIHPKEAF